MVMPMHGPAFYDDDTIFATYMAHQQQADNPPDTVEKPAVLDLVGGVAGQRILDLGCGNARFGREALEQGCGGSEDARWLGLSGHT
jgi:hypothetical protein